MVNTDTTPLAPFPFGKFIAIVLLAVLGTVLGAVLLSTHAVKRHGTEAQTIRDCLERNGAIQVWQSDAEPSVKIFCVDLEPPCGKIGIMIAQLWPSLLSRCDYRERTSFVPRDGTLEEVEEYLSRFATRIK